MGDIQARTRRELVVRVPQCVRQRRGRLSRSASGRDARRPHIPAQLGGSPMKVETDAKLVTIYVNSTDKWHGRTLYSAIVDLCQQKGIAGATVTRCVEGYG